MTYSNHIRDCGFLFFIKISIAFSRFRLSHLSVINYCPSGKSGAGAQLQVAYYKFPTFSAKLQMKILISFQEGCDLQ